MFRPEYWSGEDSWYFEFKCYFHHMFVIVSTFYGRERVGFR